MGSIISPGARPDGQVVYPASVIVGRGIAHTNLLATAETSGVLRRPLSYSNTNIRPVRVDNGTRFFFRAKYPVATTTATTEPVVRWYGVVAPDGVEPDAGTGAWPDNDTVAFVTLTDDETIFIDPAADVRDTNWYYSEPIGIADPFDAKGFRWLLPMVVTAAVLTDGTNPTGCQLEVFVLN